MVPEQGKLKLACYLAAAVVTAFNPASDKTPARCHFLANCTWRSPTLAPLLWLSVSGRNSKLNSLLSSSGQTARGMMWSPVASSPAYGPLALRIRFECNVYRPVRTERLESA